MKEQEVCDNPVDRCKRRYLHTEDVISTIMGAITRSPGKRVPGIHWIGEWMGHKAGLDAVAHRKTPLIVPTGN
jgi:hypothetical protein